MCYIFPVDNTKNLIYYTFVKQYKNYFRKED